MTGEQFAVLVEATNYIFEQENKAKPGGNAKQYGVRVINLHG